MMNRERLAASLAFASTLLPVSAGAAAPAAAPPRAPNIVLIVADDLGWGDVPWHGGPLALPHLDRLRREGVELTRHYVTPLCTPTRVALMTGRYPTRFGVTIPRNQQVLPESTVTLAEALRARDYETALIGKWHLGSSPEWGPRRHGFDRSFGSLAGGIGPYDHRYKRGPFMETWHVDGERVTMEGHVTDLIAAEAERWVGERDPARPFFLYLPFTAPHIPVKEPAEWRERVPAGIQPESRRHYAASLLHMDAAIGRVMAALERRGVADQTVVVFTSDNGADPDVPNADPDYPEDGYTAGPGGGSNAPLRGGKRELLEGGIRVPALVWAPGRLPPGRFEAPVHAIDWMPTLTGLADFRPAVDPKWDGVDVWPRLSGRASAKARSLYFAGPWALTTAVLEDPWKLHVYEDGTREEVELYHLGRDPAERHNVAEREPERVSALRARLQAFQAADSDAVVPGSDDGAPAPSFIRRR